MATKQKNLIEFNFIQPSLFKNKIKQDCAIKRDLARAVNLKKKLNFFLLILQIWYYKWQQMCKRFVQYEL